MVSCVIPAYNEGSNILPMLRTMHQLLAAHGYRHELIVVDDGSRDDTVEQIMALESRMPLTLIQLSRNFGKELALTAGLDHANGDVVVLIDADFQHPPEMVPLFLEQWKKGYDMVYGIRASRHDETVFKRWSTRMFYHLLNLGTRNQIPENTQDFRVLDRCIVDALRAMPERNRFMKGLYSWVGFTRLGMITRTDLRREGKSSFNAWRLFGLAATGLTAFSNVPLRVWTLVGGLVSMSAIVYALFIIVHTMMFGNPEPGWPTLVVGIMFLGGVQLLSIGILGEYMGRIYDEVKRRPSYFISRKIDLRADADADPGQGRPGGAAPGNESASPAQEAGRNGTGKQTAKGTGNETGHAAHLAQDGALLPDRRANTPRSRPV
jgi:glycosyltransferase involved in cell wall biosynthesis